MWCIGPKPLNTRATLRTLARILAVGAACIAATFVVAAPAGAEWPLRGYWPLFEGSGQTIHDISGNRNAGRLGRTAGGDSRDAEWVRGLLGVGKALRLDGNDYVVVPEAASLRPQRLTVEAWVKAPESPGRYKYVVSKGGDGCRAGSFGLYSSSNGGMAFYVFDGKKFWRSPSVVPSIWDGKWHHVAGSYDGTAVRLYIDGRQVGQGTPFSGRIEYDLPRRELYIGAYRGACDLTFKGDVDEIRVWSADLKVGSIWSEITKFLHLEPTAPGLPEDAGAWYDVR